MVQVVTACRFHRVGMRRPACGFLNTLGCQNLDSMGRELSDDHHGEREERKNAERREIFMAAGGSMSAVGVVARSSPGGGWGGLDVAE